MPVIISGDITEIRFTAFYLRTESALFVTKEEVQEYTDGRGMDINGISYSYHTAGRLNQLADLRVRLAAVRLTGYSLCGIIFLIGLLNMVNSALTSMVLRRREFAMLETVGMTRAQLRRMLLYDRFHSVGCNADTGVRSGYCSDFTSGNRKFHGHTAPLS